MGISPDMKDVVAKLHPFERSVLPFLKTENELSAIARKSKLQEIEAMRALQWLENKGVLRIQVEKKKIVDLDKNGLRYRREGLPEKRFLQALADEFKGLNVITKKSKLSREEVNASIGLLRRENAIEVMKGKDEIVQLRLTEKGKKLREETTAEETFLAQAFPLDASEIDDLPVLETLRKRGLLRVEEKKTFFIELTAFGKELAAIELKGEVINRLTAEMLTTGAWKEKVFRAYDVEINVPRKYRGKVHFVTQATDYARRIWLDLGFQEMTGNIVQTSFWNFDALFTAQDHPVRELQDTFYVGGKEEYGSLPSKELVKKVKAVHENGGTTGSAGWQYPWKEEEARRNVLRTHTTVLSAQTLSSLKGKRGKFFALGKCFRNEALDWSHLFEFNQTEGIVVDKDANFRHLLGYLKEFFRKMGFPQARFRPAFFPYTEPSVEIDVFHPVHKKWIELGGAGIFRPEVVVPLLGEDIPVLAWGPGFDRIIIDYYGITDIRDLYKNDIKQLREMKAWLR